jgi:putative hydrolase of the HAD superfamily
MSFQNITTISFDATGTLFDPLPSIGAIYAEVLQENGIFLSEPELEMRFMSEFHKSRAQTLSLINEVTERERWKRVVEGILREEYTEAVFNSLWNSLGEGYRWKTKPKLKTTLHHLKELGFKLIVVSNWDQRLHRILANLNITKYFDQIFISTELGVEKPSEDIYRKVASELDSDSTSFLHLGNSPSNDLKPALRAGWNALLLHNRIPHGLEPGNVLGSLDQLPEILMTEQAVIR